MSIQHLVVRKNGFGFRANLLKSFLFQPAAVGGSGSGGRHQLHKHGVKRSRFELLLDGVRHKESLAKAMWHAGIGDHG